MQVALIVLGLAVALLVAALAGLSYWFHHRLEKAENSPYTACGAYNLHKRVEKIERLYGGLEQGIYGLEPRVGCLEGQFKALDQFARESRNSIDRMQGKTEKLKDRSGTFFNLSSKLNAAFAEQTHASHRRA